MGFEMEPMRFEQLLSESVRNGIYKKKEFHGRGAKIVNMGELFANPRLYSIEMKLVELSDSEQDRFALYAGDLLFARRSLVAEGAGKCSIVMETDGLTTFESSIIRARPDPDQADSLYLYYYFNSPAGKHALGTIRRDMAVAGITGSDLAQLEIPLPPLPEQRAIAHVLGTLDDKIELNRRMNETLEAMARALFKSWFVDFDPVRAKMEGRPTGLPPELDALFPDALVGSALGEIPVGWEVVPIGEAVQVVGGGTPSTKNPAYWEDGRHAFCTPKDMSGLDSPALLETERLLTDAGVNKISSGQLPVGTVLMSSRAPIGYLAITEIPVSVNQGIIAMICDKSLPNLYVLHWADASTEHIEANANGSTFMEISKKNFRPIPVLVPSDDVLRQFEHVVQPLYLRIVASLRESLSLAMLRNTLLPNLISGQVRITDNRNAV